MSLLLVGAAQHEAGREADRQVRTPGFTAGRAVRGPNARAYRGSASATKLVDSGQIGPAADCSTCPRSHLGSSQDGHSVVWWQFIGCDEHTCTYEPQGIA
ncbi:MAG: hypothetical protein ACT4RN_12155 [Pseudonocardia sp.]